jgi:hypothetical protein
MPHLFRPLTLAGVLALLTLAAVTGCNSDGTNGRANLIGPAALGAGSGEPSTARIAFPFDPNNFVAGGDNPFFPLTPGLRYSYVAETADGVETNEVEVTHDTKVILGVTTTVIRDKVFLDGSLIEDTFDWYAQDKQGNVWYLGEDTKEYENGVPVSNAGSWEAGVNGAQAGIIMLANPKIGDQYYQENAPGVVEDQGKVLGLKETVTVPFGTYTNCLVTAEWTPIEPGNRAFKYYARGVGLVLEIVPHKGRERVELVGFSTP